MFYSLILGKNIGIQNLFIALAIAPIIICLDSEKTIKNVLTALPIGLFFIFSYLNYIQIEMLSTIKINKSLEYILFTSIFTIIIFITYLILDHFSSSTQTVEKHLIKSLEDVRKKESKIKKLLEEAEKTASLLHLMNEYNHEIKSPWAIIISGLDNPTCSHQKLKETILNQYDRVEHTLNTMINILKGNRKPHYMPININTAIQNAMDLFHLRAFQVITNLGNLPNMNGDLQDLQILFVNLFKNTIEGMAEEKQTVLIVTRHQKETKQIYIQITDTGKGIPENILTAIQNDEYITSKEKGGGIGLMVVKRIIRQHKGTLTLFSQKGLGSVFTIMFPTCDNQMKTNKNNSTTITIPHFPEATKNAQIEQSIQSSPSPYHLHS